MNAQTTVLESVLEIYDALEVINDALQVAHAGGDPLGTERAANRVREVIRQHAAPLVHALRVSLPGGSPFFDDRLRALEEVFARAGDVEIARVLRLRLELDAAASKVLRGVEETGMARLAVSAWALAAIRRGIEWTGAGTTFAALRLDGIMPLWNVAVGKSRHRAVPAWLPVVVPIAAAEDVRACIEETEDPMIAAGAVALVWLQETGRIPGLLAPLQRMVAAGRHERRVLHAMMRATRPGALN